MPDTSRVSSSDLLRMRRNGLPDRQRVRRRCDCGLQISSGMRSPWRWMEELYLLGHQQGAEFQREAFDEILVLGQPWGQPYGAARSGRVVSLLISPFLIRGDADRALSARHHTAVRPFLEFLALRTSHRRPAVTQRLVLLSNSLPCGHLTADLP
jgi:hypothetical protein